MLLLEEEEGRCDCAVCLFFSTREYSGDVYFLGVSLNQFLSQMFRRSVAHERHDR